jgi:nitrogen-specific signal transduction histidine kinase/ActR/RegA family two-component response regulator
VEIAQDITERKRAEAERENLQTQLVQAQKMESIGRLAGGVAHDFNNLLTVINGYSDLLLARLRAGDPLRDSLTQIRKAGGRAAELTAQLLAFGRKQAVQLRPVSVSRLVMDSVEMLQRLVGEDIDLVTELDPAPGEVMADEGQLHQVLMNLAANARAAMPAGGRLVIRTSRRELDEGGAAEVPGAVPGACVVLEVSDSGTGMSEEVRQNIFEPFFTTKEVGQGTGLGLAMVYGIVRQAGGWITVESQPGAGSTFRIGLPLLPEAASGVRPDTPKPAAVEGSETVLVAEDQDQVRKLAVAILEAHGYRTLEARSGDEALEVAGRHPGPIHLLLTDVVMPRMSGAELASRLKAERGELKVLYMSGYTADRISLQVPPDPSVDYLQKPFSPEALAEQVRALLERRPQP